MYKVVNLTSSHIELATRIFPELASRPQVDLFWGLTSNEGKLAGAAFLTAMNREQDTVHAFGIRMLSDAFSEQKMSQLMDTIEESACTHSITKLMKMKPAEYNREIEFYRRRGFSPMRWVSYHEVNLKSLFQLVAPLIEKNPNYQSEKRDWKPYDCDSEAMDYLCIEGFELLTFGHLGATGRMEDGKDYRHSFSLWNEGKLVAGLGIGIEHNQVTFDPLIIHPHHQNSWVFAEVISHATKKLIDDGFVSGKTIIMEDNKKMMKFIERARPNLTKRTVVLAK